MKPLQTRTMPVIGQQASTVGLQATTVPATTAAQLDINTIMNMMILLMVVVMMMKMMTAATEKI
jgi:hypothetical protein